MSQLELKKVTPENNLEGQVTEGEREVKDVKNTVVGGSI